MSISNSQPSPRRIFLRQVGGASSAAVALPALFGGFSSASSPAHAARANSATAEAAATGLLSLSPQESAVVQALVNVMCPADALTPSGADCGLHIYIDRQLAGAWGRGDRLYRQGPWMPGKPQHGYQSPLTPEQHFKEGLSVLRAAARTRSQVPLEQLDPERLDALLQEVASGTLDDERFALASWFNEAFYPLFTQACFADPIYGGNRDKVFWRAAGYPGLPAVHGRDVVTFRGKAFPGAANPKSIEDFS